MPSDAADELEAITQRAVADLVELVADPDVVVPDDVRNAVADALRQSHDAVFPFRSEGRTLETAVAEAQERAREKIRDLLFPYLPPGISQETMDLLRDSVRERVARFNMHVSEALLKFMREELRRRRRPS